MNNKDELIEKGKQLHSHLSEQFKKLQPKEQAPQELKKSVFSTLDTFQLMADVADLFTVKFTKTEAKAIDLLHDRTADPDVENPDAQPPTE
jgi:hypothetical protein